MVDSPQNSVIVAKDTHTPKRPWWQVVIAICLIAALLAFGVTVSLYLINTTPTADRQPPTAMQTLVQARVMAPETAQVIITGYGRVIPSREITLQARVSGTVTGLHPNFLPGGFVSKDDVLVQLDDTDYRLQLQERQNTLRIAQADLRLEQGNQNIAREEWRLLREVTNEIDASSQDIALRQPQLAKTEAAVQAALLSIEKAELELSRTTVKAPFDAVVRTRNIALGTQVTPQTSLGLLAGSDQYWLEVTVPTSKLKWLDGLHKNTAITIYTGDDTSYRVTFLKLLPDLEKEGLMARLLLAVDNPLAPEHARPLLLGSFIRAEIAGRRLENVYRIPRSALQEDRYVFLVSEAGKLVVKDISTIWENKEFAFISAGLSPGDRLVVSTIPAPVAGMDIKIIDAED